MSRKLVLALAAVLLLASCATVATAPLPTTIDINNTNVEHTSPIQLGDNTLPAPSQPAR